MAKISQNVSNERSLRKSYVKVSLSSSQICQFHHLKPFNFIINPVGYEIYKILNRNAEILYLLESINLLLQPLLEITTQD
jgi:hypothetical protein